MKRNMNHSPKEEGYNTFWISVSDLMAGIVFIFLILLTVFSIQFKEEQNSFIEAKNELQAPAKTRSQILLELKNVLKKNGLEVEIDPEEGILRLSEHVLTFTTAKALPNTENLMNIGRLAKALTSVLPCYSRFSQKNDSQEKLATALPEWCSPPSAQEDYTCDGTYKSTIETVMIEGHTDSMNVKAGAGYRDNLALSAARATTVLRLLKQCDSKLGHLFNQKGQPIIGASGYSDLRPIIKDNPRDHRNRRIDIRFVMDLPNNALEPAETLSSARSMLNELKGQ